MTTEFPEYPDENNNEPLTPAGKIRNLFLATGTPIEEIFSKFELFTQMDILIHFDAGRLGWKEVNRWLKYEESVESGNRWSKPHIATNRMRALTKLRRIFASPAICFINLDARVPQSEKTGAPDIDEIVSCLKDKLPDSEIRQIKNLIFLPHKHQHRPTGNKTTQKLPTQISSDGEGENMQNGKISEDAKLKKRLLRRRSGDGKNIAEQYYKYPTGANPENLYKYKPNKNMARKLPPNSESANILVGQVSFLEETIVVFCRLKVATKLEDLSEVDLPVKFLFLLLGPTATSNRWELLEIGKAMGSLFSDKIFVAVAHYAETREDLLHGLDEFIDDCTVVPPSVWDPDIQVAPPMQSIKTDKMKQRLNEYSRQATVPEAPDQEDGSTDDPTLNRTGRIFGGLVNDIKARYPYYLSDLTDALCPQTLATTIFIFFACITPIVTFGGLMGQKTDGYMGTMETLLAGAICGVFYAVFSGQPLTIVGATGPLLIYEAIVYSICKENGLDYLPLRFWIGAWITLLILFIVAFDLSFLVRYITRFTEESFALLISAIFIYEAFVKVSDIFSTARVHTGIVREMPDFDCRCLASLPLLSAADAVDARTNRTLPGNNTVGELADSCLMLDGSVEVRRGCTSEHLCLVANGTLLGDACFIKRVTDSVCDVFFLSVIIFVGTFLTAISLRGFRFSPYFPTIVRSTTSDFAVLISILIFTGLDYLVGIPTPKLSVPAAFAPTRPDRSWLVNPMAVTHWWLALATILPSIIAVVLIFLDQQITAVIINRKEHKLKKPHGYHLDMFVLAIIIFICSILGLPWFVAATVRSLSHVKSLCYDSKVTTPGEKPQMIGVREQRVTGILIHILIGCATMITVVLKLIPMPVLYGIFLYMGVTSLAGVQFVDRISIMLMPIKYQPDYVYLRHVRTMRVHLFTVIQIVCFAALWAVKTVKQTAIAFPLMLIFLMGTRKVLDLIFNQADLYWLDHLLPEEIRRKRDDQKKENINGDQEIKKFDKN